ncbi:MAG: ABC transporter permease subunit, partial [Chloroflexi bacterium]|nr:ABC transporter permease subunit [Chloroflexota bacterium]
QPILYLFVFGVGLSSAVGGGIAGARGAGGAPGGVEYTTFMYPGVLAMSVLFTAIFSSMSIVWDREFGFLKEIQVAPIPRSAVAVGKALGGSTVAMLQSAVLLALAPFVGVAMSPLIVLATLGLMFLLAFALASIGVAIASRMRTMEGFQVVMNFVLMPLLFLSGAFFPLQGLPGWLAVLTHLDPVAYAVDAIRRVVLGGAGVPSELLASVAIADVSGAPLPFVAEVGILLAFIAAGLALAVRWFSATE